LIHEQNINYYYYFYLEKEQKLFSGELFNKNDNFPFPLASLVCQKYNDTHFIEISNTARQKVHERGNSKE
jgi:predicted solute-binding protein